jgi:transcriptional regulator with XRE-family HTH domain
MATITRRRPTPVLIEQALVGLGERLALARKARELTQAELARLADVGISTVAALEGGHDGVAVGNLLKVLSALQLLEQAHQLLLPEKDPELIRYAQRVLRA